VSTIRGEVHTTRGKATHELEAQFQPSWLELSRDAKLLVSVGSQGRVGMTTVKLWDVATGKEIQELKGYPGWAQGAHFSPDGKWLALANRVDGGTTGVVTLWSVKGDVSPCQLVHTLRGFTGIITGMAFSPDSQRLVSLSYRPPTTQLRQWVAGLKIWDIGTDKVTHDVELSVIPSSIPVFSPDGQQLAFGANDRAVHVWNVLPVKERWALRGHTREPIHVAYSPDGKLLASSGGDGDIYLWDPLMGVEVRTLRAATGADKALAFSADGQRLLGCNHKNCLTVWDPHTGQDPLVLRANNSRFWGLAVSPDGRQLACAAGDGTVKVWDPATGQQLLTLRGHTTMVLGVAYRPDGKCLASSSYDGTVKLWDTTTGQVRHTLEAHKSRVVGVAFSPDGQRLATNGVSLDARGQNLWEVKLWSVAPVSDPLFSLTGHTAEIVDVAFSPDGQRLVSTSVDKTARIWDLKTGRELCLFTGHSHTVLQARFSPDGRHIASTSDDYTVKVWDTVTGKVIHDLTGHTGPSVGVAFSHDGERLASSSDDGTVKIWDTASGQELLTLRGHHDQVWSVVFGPKDQWLASSGSKDGTVRLWESTPLTPERRLQYEAGSLVNRLAEEVVIQDEILARLRDDASLSEPLRRLAMTLAERHRDDPQACAQAGFAVTRKPGADIAKYRLALRQTQTACSLTPPDHWWHWWYLNLLSLAQYRLGHYQEARDTLERELAILPAFGATVVGLGVSFPLTAALITGRTTILASSVNLAVRSMVFYHLEEKDKARACLNQLRELVKQPQYLTNQDAQALLREAEALIEGKAPDPKK
jgi:WD40 repeat protein